MARSRTPTPANTDSGQGHDHQQDPRSTLEWPPRAVRDQLKKPPIGAHCELEHDEILMKTWSQFQANWKLWEERRQSIGSLPTRLYDCDHASTSNLREARTRFSHPTSSCPCQDTDFASTFDAGSRDGSLPRDHQLHQHRLTHPPPPSLSRNYKTQQRRPSQKAYAGNRESSHRPSSASPARVFERFVQGGSNWPIASVQPRDYENAPIRQPPTARPPPDPSVQKLRGLMRRPRVQISHKRVYRVRGCGLGSVDPETSQATEMDCSVMSVRPNPEGSGSSLSSRFAHPPTTERLITIGGSDGGACHLGAFPSSHVNSETEQPGSGIKAQEEPGSVSPNTHSIPKEEPHTTAIPSLMSDMEEEWPSSSPVSTPKAPFLDQQYVIRGDLQREDERLIAGCRTDPQVSFREAAAVEDRRSLEFVRSTSPSPGVSHLQSHAVPVKEGDGRTQPGQQALFQELYQMLEPPGSDALRSRMEVHRDRKPGEGIIRQDCVNEEGSIPDAPRGPEGSEQELHADILLAQRVVRDVMQEDEECLGQSYMQPALECGEEAVDSSSNWAECGLDRKHSTRSVFDWGYA